MNGAYLYDTFSLGEGMMKALLSKEGEPGNLFQDWATPEKNLFFINLQDYFVWRDPQTANQAYAKQMDIAVDPTAILPNPYGRIQPSGTVFDVDESLLYKDFSLGKNPENVSFTLHKLDGVNFENAEVRIWDTVMEPDENGVYTIDQAPIYYKSTEKIQNELSITAYRIFLSGVDYSACEDLFVLTMRRQIISIFRSARLIKSNVCPTRMPNAFTNSFWTTPIFAINLQCFCFCLQAFAAAKWRDLNGKILILTKERLQ